MNWIYPNRPVELGTAFVTVDFFLEIPPPLLTDCDRSGTRPMKKNIQLQYRIIQLTMSLINRTQRTEFYAMTELSNLEVKDDVPQK